MIHSKPTFMTRPTNAILVGNPNCGKTTLFNVLTGSSQRVGNWSGVTIERAEGHVRLESSTMTVMDLPGLYTLTPYSPEEEIAVAYLRGAPPDHAIINIVDCTNLERHLFLTLQLLALNRPMVIALNMTDALKIQGKTIDTENLSALLGVPVLAISALKERGLEALKQLTLQASMVGASGITAPREEVDTDPIGLYERIDDLLPQVLTQKDVKSGLSEKLDKVLTNRWLGMPLFFLMMYLVFSFTFSVGGFFIDTIDIVINDFFASQLTTYLTALQVAPWLISLIIDGIISGVGGVLTFLPNIMLLFLAIALLEDSGYMARVAFITDRLMSRLGLNGKAIVPLVMGFGCNTPAIMSTRILESSSDRLIAILINPFMSCGARLPIYILFASVFFKGYESLVTFSLYLLGIIMAVLSALLFKKTLFATQSTPFLMELPPYRLPSLKNVRMKLLGHAKAYLKRAGSVIFVASCALWFILSFGPQGYGDLTSSYGKQIGIWIAPVLAPSGFGNWQAALSLLTGIIAKEIVVSNMFIIFGSGAGGFGINGLGIGSADLSTVFTPLSAYAFMVFSLLYTPCIAVIAAIYSETRSWKWPIFSVLYGFSAAWLVSVLVYRIGYLIF